MELRPRMNRDVRGLHFVSKPSKKSRGIFFVNIPRPPRRGIYFANTPQPSPLMRIYRDLEYLNTRSFSLYSMTTNPHVRSFLRFSFTHILPQACTEILSLHENIESRYIHEKD